MIKSIVALLRIASLIAKLDYSGGLIIVSCDNFWKASFMAPEIKSNMVMEIMEKRFAYKSLEEALMALITEYFEKK